MSNIQKSVPLLQIIVSLSVLLFQLHCFFYFAGCSVKKESCLSCMLLVWKVVQKSKERYYHLLLEILIGSCGLLFSERKVFEAQLFRIISFYIFPCLSLRVDKLKGTKIVFEGKLELENEFKSC